MATFTLQFTGLNVSIQPTDIVYACLTENGQAGINTPNVSTNTKPFPIGIVEAVRHGDNQIDVNDSLVRFESMEENLKSYKKEILSFGRE